MFGTRLLFAFSGRKEITPCKSDSIKPNNVVLVTITNVKFPVNIDILCNLFSKYGEVLRVRSTLQ